MFKLKWKSEKGSITVYVLVAMLLMISVLTIIYLQANQKNNNQLRELSTIQNEYQTNGKTMDDSYNEILDKNDMEIYIVLTTPDGKQYDINQWTNQDLKLKIFYPKDASEDEKYYYKDDEKLKYTENEIIEDNCTIRVEYGDKEKEVQITKIDKILPTVTLNQNGGNETINVGNTTANISAKVEATDNESGVKTIEYQISSSETMPSEDDSNWQEIENGGTISESKEGGKYYIYTKVTDNTGNVSIQKSQGYNVNYEVKYDANGGSGEPSAQAKVQGTALTLSSTKPTRTGYTFVGWNTNKDATTAQYQPGGSYTDNNTVILYAIWKVNSYNVKFDNNYMTSNLMPSTYTSSTYAGWRVTTTNSVVTDSTVMDGQAVKIVFSGADGRSGIQKYFSKDLTVGKTYTFSVYLKASKNHNNVGIGPQQGGIISVNVTTSWQKFTHTFVATENQYSSFIFYSNIDASIISDRWNNGDILYVSGLEVIEGSYNNYTQSSKTYNTTLGTLPTPTKTGYTLDGWYTAPIGGTKISTSTRVPANNVTYYAHWKDTITPSMGSLTASTTRWTNQNITLTGKATDVGSGLSYYQFSTNPSLTASSGGWTSITNSKTEITATFSASTNATYYFYVKDIVGNVNKKSIVVNRIDKTSPSVPTVKSSYKIGVDPNSIYARNYSNLGSIWTTGNSDPYIDFKPSGDLDKYKNVTQVQIGISNVSVSSLPIQVFYSKGSNGYTQANSVTQTFTRNSSNSINATINIPKGTYNGIRVDIGNKAGIKYGFGTIDLVADNGCSHHHYIRTMLSSTDNASGIAKYQQSKDKKTWTDCSSTNTYDGASGQAPATYYYRAIDNAGNVGAVTAGIYINYKPL